MRFLRSEVKREPPIQTGGGAPHQDPAVAVRLVLRGSSQLAKANAELARSCVLKPPVSFCTFLTMASKNLYKNLGFGGFLGHVIQKTL